MTSLRPSRRRFLAGLGLAGTVGLLPQRGLAQTASPSQAVARNLIFLVSDGAGTGTLAMTDYWRRLDEGKPTEWTRLYGHERIVTGLQETSSATSPVTDSAAAASAWGGGEKVNNRAVNVAPDGRRLTPFYELAKQAGKATGLVTTCRLSHATPAGFAASAEHRYLEDEIARQYIEAGVDLLLGGSPGYFRGDEGPQKMEDMIADYARAGYQIARTRDELKETDPTERLLGTFASSHVPYAIDRANDPKLAHVPSLETMFQQALTRLSPSPEGFVLQVEAGRVDHAAHNNEPAPTIFEQLEFDRCIPIALEFVEKHPDTLLIVTTDHGTGGGQLNGQGSDYNGSTEALGKVRQISASHEGLSAAFAEAGQVDADRIEEATGIRLEAAVISSLQKELENPEGNLERALIRATIAQFEEKTAIGWTSHQHTAEFVELLALGPGSQQIPPYFENQELNRFLRKALGLPV